MRPFLVSRAGGGGLPYKRTRSLHAPTRGVRNEGGEWLDDVAAVALVMPDGALFSHVTAAQLLNLPLPASLKDHKPLHVSTPRRRGSREIVKWHEVSAPIATLRVRGLPVTDLQRTWQDLAVTVTGHDLIAVTDVILRRKPSGLMVPAGIRGAVELRKALALADPRSNSPRESSLRVSMREAGLPTPQLNVNVIHEGEWVGCGDFVWPHHRLYLEYDGGHHGNPRQRHQDAQTRNQLAELGWQVRVVTAAMSTHEVVEMVRLALSQGGWRG